MRRFAGLVLAAISVGLFLGLFSSLALSVATAASDPYKDYKWVLDKVVTDEEGWFYLKVCATEGEAQPLRKLLDAHAALPFHDYREYGNIVDSSEIVAALADSAYAWAFKYNGLTKADFPPGRCDEAKDRLRSSIYGEALK